MEWRPVPGFEDLYEVSDEGVVRSKDRTFTYRTGTQIVRPGRVLHPRVMKKRAPFVPPMPKE